MQRHALLCAVVLAVACGGGSDRSAAPVEPSPTPTPSDASPAPAPSPTPAPSPSPEPSPAPTPDPSPTPAPDPSPTPTPTPTNHPSVRITRTSSDPECDAVVPQHVAAPVYVTMPPISELPLNAGNEVCGGPAISDGTGAVAIPWRCGRGWCDQAVFSSGGARVGQFSSSGGLIPQASGWIATGASDFVAPYDPVWLRAFGPDGALRGEQLLHGSADIRWWGFGHDPAGGVLLLLAGPVNYVDGTCWGEVWRFDSAGAVMASPSTELCPTYAAVSRLGDALVFASHRAGEAPEFDGTERKLIAAWIRRDGTLVSQEPDGPTMSEIERDSLVPLLDGSILAWSPAGLLSGRYAYHSSSRAPAPAWLAPKEPQDWQLRFTRGNRGYALFPRRSLEEEGCVATELRAPSGRLCGTLEFLDDAGACVQGLADQGWDGTVVQHFSTSWNPLECRYRWWPGLLANP